jgi:hypothetical protein
VGRTLFIALLMAASASGAVPLQGVRPQEISIAFEAPDDPSASAGAMDLGRLPLRPGRHVRAAGTRRIVRVRLRAATASVRFARLSARLDGGAGGCIVRVDGVRLGPMPQLIDASAPIGLAVSHTIEFDVPASEPAGAVAASITWLAETDS